MPPEPNFKNAVFVLGKVEILAWDKGCLHETGSAIRGFERSHLLQSPILFRPNFAEVAAQLHKAQALPKEKSNGRSSGT